MMNWDGYNNLTASIARVLSLGLVMVLIALPASSQDSRQMASAEEQNGDMHIEKNVKAASVLNKIISVDLKKSTLEEALLTVAEKAGLKLSYSTSIVPVDNKLTIKVDQLTVNNVLWRVLEGTGLRFAVSPNQHLVIMSREESRNIDYKKLETVSGQVTDATTGESMPGVNILVKGTSTGTSTDVEGDFELSVPSLQDTLIFSFIGYQTREVPINGQTALAVAMQPQAISGQEIVVSGYQIQEEATVTGAGASVDMSELEDAQTTDPVKALQGQTAGVYVETSGDPSGGATVRIRGVSTLNNNDPLYVIDGVPTKSYAPQQLNPDDIESMRVLKDAAASSIYGARASNGVILITTKKADQGSFQVDYSGKYTNSRYTTGLNMANTEEQARILWLAAMNDGTPPPTAIYSYDYDANAGPDAEGLDRWGDAVLYDVSWPEEIGPGMPSSDTDWFDAISETGNVMEHQLSMSTGTESSSVRLSLRYLTNDYILKFQDYEKITARINSHQDFLDGDLRVGENFSITQDAFNGFQGSVVGLAQIAMPILPVKTTDGGYAGPPGAGFDDRQNPVRLLDHNKWDRDQNLNLFGDIYARLNLLEDRLSLNTRLGLDYGANEFRDIQRTYQTGFLSRDINSLNRTKGTDVNWNFNATAEYQLDFEQHETTFLVGTEAFRNTFSQNSITQDDFALETLDYFIENAGTGSSNVSGYNTGYSLLSFFGKFDYSFRSKYLASVTIRRDGSSRFGRENRFGTFPAASVGWRLTEEPFVAENLSFLSNFKIRASYGITGNQEIANNARFTEYEAFYGDEAIAFNGTPQATAYDIEGNDTGLLPSGFVRTQTGNQSLRWEESEERNIGVDFGLFDDRLTGSFDYFVRNTSDILIQPAYIATRGEGGSRWENGASMRTSGLELELNYRGQSGSFNYSVAGNVGHYSDEITDLPPEVVDSYPGNSEKNILGESVNSFFGYVNDGLFDSQEEVDQHADQSGAAPGRLKFRDLNGDGQITSLDQQYIGVDAPDYEFGLNLQGSYKGFDLRVFFQGVLGRDVNNSQLVYQHFSSFWNGSNFGKELLYKGWKPNRRDTNVPAPTGVDNNDEGGGAGGGGRYSTYWVRNGSYLKLRQITLGYTPPSILGLSNARLFLTGQNIWTLKDTSGDDAFVGPDPEDPGLGFPIPLQLTVGLDLSF
ncbi:SusC/RagA family TonB-linked outer membrane protein [Halalkalibaculum sp. DA3122]|uniref:SusC/RagA family TonB-linked outer membrane protein n=1 Tax=unclassified Halalkalibaculum TaxID=2964617 RepID=UPI003754FD16